MKGKMLLVKNIEFVEVDKEFVELLHTRVGNPKFSLHSNKGSTLCTAEEIRELVKGRRFYRPDGAEIIIGCSAQAAEIIGIQYEARDDISKRAEMYHANWISAKNMLEHIHSLSL